jgi:hypothetical protein
MELSLRSALGVVQALTTRREEQPNRGNSETKGSQLVHTNIISKLSSLVFPTCVFRGQDSHVDHSFTVRSTSLPLHLAAVFDRSRRYPCFCPCWRSSFAASPLAITDPITIYSRHCLHICCSTTTSKTADQLEYYQAGSCCYSRGK